MRCPDAHSRSDLTWGGTRALGPFPATTRDVTAGQSSAPPVSGYARRAFRRRLVGLRSSSAPLKCWARVRRVVRSGSMAEQDVLPPDRGAHELGPVDFGLFEESWRQTFAFSPGASSEGRSCRWLNAIAGPGKPLASAACRVQD